MKLIKQADFARQCRVSSNAILQGIQRGALVAIKEGQAVYLDLNNPINRAYHSSKQPARKQPAGHNYVPPPIDPDELNADASQLSAKLKEFIGVDSSLAEFDELSETFANKIKTFQQIYDLQVRTAKVRMKLVDRDTVKRMFGKIYTIDVNEFRMLGMNLAPELAAIANIENPEVVLQISKRIDKEVFIILNHVKGMLNKFLMEMELKEVIGADES